MSKVNQTYDTIRSSSMVAKDEPGVRGQNPEWDTEAVLPLFHGRDRARNCEVRSIQIYV